MEMGGCYQPWRQLQSLGMNRDRAARGERLQRAESAWLCTQQDARAAPRSHYLQPLLTPLSILLCISELCLGISILWI